MRLFLFISLFCGIGCQLKGDPVSWATPEVISSEGVDCFEPKVTIDSNGNVLAAWIEDGVVKSRAKPFNGEWSDPSSLSYSGASKLRLKIDSNGNAIALWVEDGFIKTASRPNGGNWGGYETLSSSGASSPQLAVDSSGNAVAVWLKDGDVESATKLSGGSWPYNPDVILASEATKPCVSMGNGVVHLVWCDQVDYVCSVYASHKTVDGEWSSSERISTLGQNTSFPKVAVDSSGNAIAAWFRYDIEGSVVSNVVLQYASKPNIQTWLSPVDISEPGVRISCELALYYDQGDYFFVAWSQSYDGSTFVLQTAVKPTSSEWIGITNHLSGNIHPVNIDCSVADKIGRIIYVFSVNGSSDLQVTTAQTKFDAYVAGFWTYPDVVSVGEKNGQPKVAATQIEDNYHTAAVWRHYDGANTTVHFSSGIGSVLHPPSNLEVRQELIDLQVLTEYCNILSWEPSSGYRIKGYLIYRNGTYVNRLPMDAIEYIDHNQNLNESVTYGISTINEDFCQSEITYITFP
jgi:hypothetical protein